MARAAARRRRPSKYEECVLFCDFLWWHLRVWGTRPEGSPDREGKPWTNKEFAIALGAGARHQTLETEQRKIRDWLEGKYGPSNIPAIEAALFGSNPAWKSQRLALRRAPIRRNDGSRAHPQRSRSQPISSKSLLFNVPSQFSWFIGRKDDLSRLRAALGDPKSPNRVALHGMRGVGKTCLAVEYAYRYGDAYGGVWWCYATTREQLLTSLSKLALELGEVLENEQDLEKAAAAALRRLAEESRSWLLVYDNAPSPEALEGLLPTSGARVLITSTFSDWAGWADEIFLGVMPADDAIDFLQTQVGRGDLNGASALSETLGYLPLALDHASAYCRRTGMQFTDYASRVERLIKKAPRSRHYPKSIYATFSMALREAAKVCSSTPKLITFLSHCSPDPIPARVLDGAIDSEEERLEAIACLAEVSLIRHQFFPDGAPAFTIHRLVQSVGRLRSPQNKRASAIKRLIQTFSTLFPTDIFYEPPSWEICARLAPHVLAIRAQSVNRGPNIPSWSELLRRLGIYYHTRAVYSLAEEILRESAVIAEKVHGPEHVKTAECLNALAHLLMDKGDLSSARSMFERVLVVVTEAFTIYSPVTIACFNNLGLVLQASGDIPGARRYFEMAMEYGELILYDDLLMARINGNLAVVAQLEGNFGEARRLYQHALTIVETKLGPNHVNTDQVRNNLSVFLTKTGNFAEAVTLNKVTLETREQVLGPKHPGTAIALNNLGVALLDSGDTIAARPHLERALKIREDVLGPDHYATADSLHNFATLLRVQGAYGEARKLYERAIRISERALGRDHPQTDAHLSGLAHLLFEAGELTASHSIFEGVLESREHRLGSDHIELAETLSNLGAVLSAKKELDQSQRYYTRALEIQERWLDPEHPEIARTLHNLGGQMSLQGNYLDAQRVFNRALAIRKIVCGEQHPDTAATMYGLACALRDPQSAKQLALAALTIQQRVLGQDHPHTNLTRAKLAFIELCLGRAKEAAALAAEALQAHEQKLGRSHSWTIDTAMTIIEALEALGRGDEANAVRARFDIS
jgi:tetratricopeptide (TPR) repeat protein